MAFRPPGPRNRRLSPTLTVVAFALAGLVAMLVISLAVMNIAERDAKRAAIREARDLTTVNGLNAIAPALSDEFLAGDPTAVATMDRIVRERVLSDRVVRVKIWNKDGKVLYSDDAAAIGTQFPLGPDETEALFDGTARAEVSNTDSAETVGEASFDKLLEVYDGIRAANGEPVLFEAYLTYGTVEASGARLATAIVPALLAGLTILFVIQIPLALALARALQQGRNEREQLLQRALVAGETERARIASDLHDGVVQDLVGTSYLLAAVAENPEQFSSHDVRSRTNDAASQLRQAVRDLRTLIVAIAPPRLHQEGLSYALEDAASALRQVGTEVTLDISPELEMSESAQETIYRTINEALRNVLKHAQAQHVAVRVAPEKDGLVVATVTDDGVGFTEEQARSRRSGGHVGLSLLHELVAEQGGKLDVESTPNSGTTITLQIGAQ